MKEKDKEIKDAFQGFLKQIESDYNVGLTIAFNCPDISEQKALRCVKNIFGHYYRKTLGKNWHKKKDKQCKLIAIKEMGKFGGNLHFHVMLKLEPYEDGAEKKLIDLLNKKFPKYISSGKVIGQKLTLQGEWGTYMAKEITTQKVPFYTEKDLW